MQNKLKGGVISIVGFLLSPLSWWNDLIINIPLAYGFASLVSILNKDLFTGAMIFGYWATNLLGFVLMHKGLGEINRGETKREGNKEESIKKDILISLLYTLLIVALIKFGIVRFPTEYFVSN